MGVVYEALDAEHNARVALKTLRQLTPRSLGLFKNEFRSLQHVRHPNLVSLGELFEDAGHWFFTMELVDGTDFLTYVRPGMAPPEGDAGATSETRAGLVGDAPATGELDEERLRGTLGQLASALCALHAAGKIHRDIKPANMRVSPSGRLVVLDFGLVSDVDPGGDESLPAHIVGTTAYMAPEQATSGRVGPEADWYAVGVVLYQALTGRLPYSGPAFQVLMDKQARDPEPPSALARVPEDLDALCRSLLRFDRAARPSGRDVLRVLGLAAGELAAGTSRGSSFAPFVGRARELAVLADAFEACRRGESRNLVVRGDSGMGKSALVRHFIEQRKGDVAELVTLSGRCYEREAVPYKAFDGVAEDLARSLRRLDDIDAALLLGYDGPLCARIFPALARLPAVRRALLPARELPNPQEQRLRAFAAVRTVLGRLADRGPVILSIDDGQWADADSLALLRELLRMPGAPALLTIVTARPGAPALDAALADLDVHTLELSGLEAEEGAQLVQLWSARLELPVVDAAPLWREAHGHPMFLSELVHYLFDLGSARTGAGAPPVRLDEVLGARLARLEPATRQLLETVAVAGAPLPLNVAIAASGLEPGEAARQMAILRTAMFARTTTSKGREAIEPYHDCIRAAVLAQLAPAEARAQHARLASALLAADPALADIHQLVQHLLAAGDHPQAARHAARAAEQAAQALAFDQASELYRLALAHGEYRDEERRRLLTQLAEALVNAGRCREAAAIYSELAEGASAAARLEFRRHSAELLLIGGDVERGLEQIRTVFAEVGLRFPATPRQAILTVLRARLMLRLRGLRWTERDASFISARDLEQLEFHKAVGIGLAVVDNARAQAFAARGLRIALAAGERGHVARFMSLEASFVATRGSQARPRALELMNEVRRIADAVNDPYLRAIALAARGNVDYLTGHFHDSIASYREAELLFRERAVHATWELNGTRTFMLHAIRHVGQFRELGELLADYLRDAARRGDRYVETTLSRTSNSVWLAVDDVARARRELEEKRWSPPDTGFLHLQHWYELRAHVEIDLYEGRTGGTRRALAERFSAMHRSLLVRVQTVRSELTWIEGRLALAEGDLEGAGRAMRALGRESAPYAQVWGQMLSAGLAARAGRREDALLAYAQVAEGAESLHLGLIAAVARARQGALIGGDEGQALLEPAQAWMRTVGIRHTDAMSRIVDPVQPRR